MKKLALNASALNNGEVLTRSQLKRVMGGDGSGSGVLANCKCSNGTTCPEGTTSCATTTDNGVEKISCNGSEYKKC